MNTLKFRDEIMDRSDDIYISNIYACQENQLRMATCLCFCGTLLRRENAYRYIVFKFFLCEDI